MRKIYFLIVAVLCVSVNNSYSKELVASYRLISTPAGDVCPDDLIVVIPTLEVNNNGTLSVNQTSYSFGPTASDYSDGKITLHAQFLADGKYGYIDETKNFKDKSVTGLIRFGRDNRKAFEHGCKYSPVKGKTLFDGGVEFKTGYKD